MGKPLIIVESPAKARSMSKYLGNDFVALASYGHVRDLKPKTGAVLPEEDFAMQYEILENSRKHVDQIARAMKSADALYLATDPDREGEAISWHLHELLKERDVIGDKPVYRVEFHEITAPAIRAAVQNPRELSDNLINAQQARRALDYLVGFNLSPLLWKKVRTGLSAGRVQSPALRLICEREAEIEKFVAKEYWTLAAKLNAASDDASVDKTSVKSNDKSSDKSDASDKDGGDDDNKDVFEARLIRFADEKIEQFTITDEPRAREVESTLRAAADGKLTVIEVAKKQRKRNPAPPFTTSTLQQEASRKLGFATRRTMRIAQQLYEGIDLGDEPVGLITYMRTDSVALANDAVAEMREVIKARYGEESLPETPRVFKNKTKNAQEAHEAVRPTQAARAPDVVKPHLNDEQFRLYDLIWRRALASQMIHATLDTVSVDLSAGARALGHVFRANGKTIRAPGFMAAYTEGLDDAKAPVDKEVILPPLAEGDLVALASLTADQHFTEPPPRYNEATLVKTLEAYGIGRPSTYASIIGTLLNREYAVLEQRRFEPTEIGKIVSRFLSKHFTRYIDYEFTAKMEDSLDEISRGEKRWVPIMREFWSAFSSQLAEKENISRDDAIQSRELGVDPKSGRPVSARMGRYGPLVQIGTREDEIKPLFASLPPGAKLDTITFEEAIKLFKLPRQLGETPEGEPVSVAIGRYGPYVKYGDKYVSLGEHDPYTVELPIALQLVVEKKQLDANRIILDFNEVGIQVLNGRYGPYVTDGEKNARVPKDLEDPKTLTLEECEALLKDAKPSRRAKKKMKKKTSKKTSKKSAKSGGADDVDDKVTAKAKGKKRAKKKSAKKKVAKRVAKKAAKKAVKSRNAGDDNADSGNTASKVKQTADV